MARLEETGSAMLDTASQQACGATGHELPVADAAMPGGRVEGWRKFLVDLKFLWLEQMLEVRASWPFFVTFSLLMPLSMVFGFARIGSGLTDRASLLYIVSGAAVFATATEGLVAMAMRIAWMKREGMMVYYASLPISKVAFVMAIIASRLLVTLPGMLAPMLVAPLLYRDLELRFSPWVLLLLPLTALSLSSAGMALGSLIDNVELVNALTQVLLFLLLLAAPVFIPAESLPLPLRLLGYLLPPTYAADALRHALGGTVGRAFFVDVALLLLLSGASLAGLSRWLRWRLK
jgi:ABC-2 type transport system permease protein